MGICTEDTTIDTFSFDDQLKTEWEETRQPISVTFELTPQCNFDCVHCYMKKIHRERALSTAEIKRIIDILYSKGVLFLTFTGGEALTRTDFIELYTYAKDKGFVVGLFTNAYAITREEIDVFAKYPPLLIDISLYGSNNDTYKKVTGVAAFEKVHRNMKLLKERKIRFAIKSPIIKETYAELDDMRRIAEELGADFRFSFEINPTLDKDFEPQSHEVGLLDRIMYELNDPMKIRDGIKDAQKNNPFVGQSPEKIDIPLFTCNIATTSFFIDYRGYALPCASFRSAGKNMMEIPFEDIWESFAIYRKMKANKENKCSVCNSRFFCKVCPAEMFESYGDYNKVPTNVCKISKLKKAFFKDEVSQFQILEELRQIEQKGGTA